VISAKEIVEGAIRLYELAQWVHSERKVDVDPFEWRQGCVLYARAGRAALLAIARCAGQEMAFEAVDIEDIHSGLATTGWLPSALRDDGAARLLTKTLVADRSDLDDDGWIAERTEVSDLVEHAEAAHALIEASCKIIFDASLDQIVKMRE
jgi:hypothetical protein